jgi:hypothetical protein
LDASPSEGDDDSTESSDAGSARVADLDQGAATVRTPPVTETDPLLVHVGEAIEEAKEAAREVYGDDGSESDDDVDPNLGAGAPVP